MRDLAVAALAEARHTGWDGLLASQRAYLDDFWERADVEIDGDAELQQAVRFALFHTLQAGARAEQRAIAAKGLTGPGYDGHTFWDTERFVLPVLTYTAPRAAADALRWRHSTLDLARERARQLGLDGAAFPWRTIRGQECSGYWPAGTAAFHIGADIADAVVRYQAGDRRRRRSSGRSASSCSSRRRASGARSATTTRRAASASTASPAPTSTAPSPTTTSTRTCMAQRNLLAAADAVARHPRHAAALGVDFEEAATWRDAGEDMVVPWDDDLGVHPQSEGFTSHEVWDFASHRADRYPLLLHYPYFELYRKQVVKQADLVLALHVRGDAFTDEEKARDFAYYEALTVRDSSLSASTQAVIAAEVGHLELAYDYFGEAALIDLHDLAPQHPRRRPHRLARRRLDRRRRRLRRHARPRRRLTFAPRLPARLQRLSFRLVYRGSRLKVAITKEGATYTLLDGDALETSHHGEPITVTPEAPVTREIPPMPQRPVPSQPPGREPLRRSIGEGRQRTELLRTTHGDPAPPRFQGYPAVPA